MAAKELFNTSLFLDANLKAYYRLEGNSTDSKNDYDGTDTDISYSSSYGKFGQGANFNESTSKIVIPDGALVSGSTNRTLSCWVNIDEQPATGERFSFIGWGVDSNSNACWIRYYPDGSGGYFLAFGTYGTGLDNEKTYTLTPGIWYFITVTVTSSVSQIYVNGSALGSTVSHVNMNTTGSNGRIGCIFAGGTNTRFLNGSLDDVAIFNRALTGTEISNLYNGNYPDRIPAVKTNWFL